MPRHPRPCLRSTPLLVAAALAAAACGSDQTSADVVPPTPAITPNACSLLPPFAVATALAPPPSPGAAPQAPPPAPPGTYSVVSVAGHQAGQCSYVGVLGARLVVTVVPQATVASLGITGTSLGPATLVTSPTASLLAVPRGNVVVELALDLGGVPETVRDDRLAALASLVAGAAVPTAAPQPVAQASATPTPEATPAAPGTTVSGQAATVTVRETDQLRFDPASVTVSAGAVVEWVNVGSAPHNVTFDAFPTLNSPTMNGGAHFEVRFTQAGTYQYRCTFHPGMNGSVVVG